MNIPFIDLSSQQKKIKPGIDDAIERVLSHGKYIMGPEVGQLEQELCNFSGARFCLSCSSGTDALGLVLMAWNIGPGDAVFVPSFTFVASAEVVALVGATPVFVDVLEDSYNIDPESLEKAIDYAKKQGLGAKAIMPVDIFGLPANYAPIEKIAKANNLKILCDSAQSFGAQYNGRNVGTIGDATATSFFPAKPLGCYGDGGAIFTDNEDIYNTLKSLRVHGQGTDKYDNVRIGVNGRIDTMQAAILLQKLKIFEEELVRRNEAAAYYNNALKDICRTPDTPEGLTSAWAQYTIAVPDRTAIQESCAKSSVPTAVYYSKPLHQQSGYQKFGVMPGGLPVSEKLSEQVVSLPMHPYLDHKVQDMVIDAVRKPLEQKAA